MNEGSAITSYGKWEQAFRVYMDVYVRAHPGRSSELIQYEHIISTIASQFVWENVYTYDKDFCIHMAWHPSCNWSLILHQAWAMRLRDKLRGEDYHRNKSQGHGHSKRNGDYCIHFNKTGRCSHGKGCKFEHGCSYCNKLGHPIIKCRKFLADQAEKSDGWSNKLSEDVFVNNNIKNGNFNNSTNNTNNTKMVNK